MRCPFHQKQLDPFVESPEEVRLDPRLNPHVVFGFGPHLWLGAAHARLGVRSLIKTLCERVERIDILGAVDKYETESSNRRRLAYDRREVRFVRR